MTVKPETLSGRSKEIAFIVITSNLELEERDIPNTTAIHWRDQENTYDLGCVARKPDRWLLELSLRSKLIGPMDGCHAVHKIEWKTSRRIYVVRREADKISSNHKTGSPVARNFVRNVKKQLNERKSSNGLSSNRSSTMREIWEASILLIQMLRSSKKPLHTHGNVGICQWKQPCFVSWRRTSTVRPVANPTTEIQSTLASWKPANLRESASERTLKIMRMALLGRGSIRWVITICCTSSFQCPKH